MITRRIAVGLALLLLAGCGKKAPAPPAPGGGAKPAKPARPVRTASGKKAPGPDRAVKVVCSAEGLTIEGKAVTAPFTRAKFVGILGKPSRSFNKANDIDTWDSAGALTFANPGEKNCHAFGVSLRFEETTHHPKRAFTGSLVIDGLSITAETTKKKLLASGYTFDADMPWYYDKKVGALDVIIEFSEAGEAVARTCPTRAPPSSARRRPR